MSGRPTGDLDFDVLDFGDLDGRRDRETHNARRERRGADKNAPLERWAIASTEGVRTEDRLSKVAAVLPKNLIGAHAISHLDYRDEFDPYPEEWRWWRPRVSAGAVLAERRFLRRALADVVAEGRHKAFNRFFRAHAAMEASERLFLGVHDVEAFVEHVAPGTQARHEYSAAHDAAVDCLRRLGYAPPEEGRPRDAG
jgi:hypothetical protein